MSLFHADDFGAIMIEKISFTWKKIIIMKINMTYINEILFDLKHEQVVFNTNHVLRLDRQSWVH